MSHVPADLRYTKTHEWVRALPDGTLEIGITDHAQQALGDLVCVAVPAAGRSFGAGEPCAVIESVKATAEVYCPLAAAVTQGNHRLAHEPEMLNSDPYGAGWLVRLRPVRGGASIGLMLASEYRRMLGH